MPVPAIREPQWDVGRRLALFTYVENKVVVKIGLLVVAISGLGFKQEASDGIGDRALIPRLLADTRGLGEVSKTRCTR